MTTLTPLRSVTVNNTYPYTIAIGPGLLHDPLRLAATIRGRHALILSDSEVAPVMPHNCRKRYCAHAPIYTSTYSPCQPAKHPSP